MLILIINSGSSSIKYQVLDMPDEKVLVKGTIECIGGDSIVTHAKINGGTYRQTLSLPDHRAACKYLLNLLSDVGTIDAIGHRVVHGGTGGASPAMITNEIMEQVIAAAEFAPLHNHANIIGVHACRDAFGTHIPQVAVFDTAFHRDLPPQAYLYPIPYKYYTDYGIRRFGFHGISHQYTSHRCAELMGRQDIRVITCHLGNGCSLAAVKNGKCVDTSMGMTPNEGLMMGTRSGSVDPAIIAFLARKEGCSYEEILNICNRQAGLLGISGISNDYRDLECSDKKQAKLALQMQQYQIIKQIGAYLAVLNGTDAIVFTGGIGENASTLRRNVCEHLRFAGVILDEQQDSYHAVEQKISAPDSAISVYVIPTNEELCIARDTYSCVQELTKTT